MAVMRVSDAVIRCKGGLTASCHSVKLASLLWHLPRLDSLYKWKRTRGSKLKATHLRIIELCGDPGTAPRTPDAIELPASHLFALRKPKGCTVLIRQPSMVAA